MEWLQALDAKYDAPVKIQVVLDHHAAHTSTEARAYLATKPRWFEFVFTPVHASWLNLIEMGFAKLAKQCLREIRVDSAEELETRLQQYIDWVNTDPALSLEVAIGVGGSRTGRTRCQLGIALLGAPMCWPQVRVRRRVVIAPHCERWGVVSPAQGGAQPPTDLLGAGAVPQKHARSTPDRDGSRVARASRCRPRPRTDRG